MIILKKIIIIEINKQIANLIYFYTFIQSFNFWNFAFTGITKYISEINYRRLEYRELGETLTRIIMLEYSVCNLN